MGASESLPVPPSDLNRFCIFFHGSDKLLSLRADQQALDIIEKNVAKYGLRKKSERYGEAICFKFKGFPFLATGEEDSIKLKEMFCDLLMELRQEGWHLVLTSCVDAVKFSHSMFFEKKQPQESQLTCLGLSKIQDVHLVNLNDSKLEDEIIQLLSEEWLETKEKTKEGILQMKLKGKPWVPDNDEEGNKARLMVLNIIQIFYSNGYKIYGRANPKGGNADYIFFEKGEGSFGQLMLLGLNTEEDRDSIRLYNAPNDACILVHSVLMHEWRGLVVLREEDVYKLGGGQFSPWSNLGTDEVRGKVMLTRALQTLNENGWNVESSLSVSRQSKRATTFLLSHNPPVPVKLISLAPAGTRGLRINYCSSPEMVKVVQNVLESHWKEGCKLDQFPEHSMNELWITEAFWGSSFGADLVREHNVLLILFYELAKHGWQPHSSASLVTDMVEKQDDTDDHKKGIAERLGSKSRHLHTIFFQCPAMGP